MQEPLEQPLHRVMNGKWLTIYLTHSFASVFLSSTKNTERYFDPSFFLPILSFGNAGSYGTFKMWTNEGDGKKKIWNKKRTFGSRNFSVLIISQRETKSHSNVLFLFRQIFVHMKRKTPSEFIWKLVNSQSTRWHMKRRRRGRRKAVKKKKEEKSSMCVLFWLCNSINFVLTCRNATIIICLWRWKHLSSKHRNELIEIWTMKQTSRAEIVIAGCQIKC